MTRWLISVPVWGERYVDVFLATTLPAINRAAEALLERGEDVRLVVHTDQPEKVGGQTNLPYTPRPVPAGLRDFDCMSQAHREVLGMACRGDVVALMTADAVINAEGLGYAASALDDPGKKLIMCTAMRALEEGRILSTEGAALAAWAWANRHPLVEAATWPDGRAADLSRMFFARAGTAVMRWALPHPLAVRIDGRPLAFTPTVDANLMQCFHHSEIHLATDCSKLALVELSPRDKSDRAMEESIHRRLMAGQIRVPDPLQRWCLNHKVVVVGPPRDCGDDALVRKIFEQHGGIPS